MFMFLKLLNQLLKRNVNIKKYKPILHFAHTRW